MPTISERRKAALSTSAPHVIIIARAGTGKTTTLVEGLKNIKGQTVNIQPSEQQQAIWDELEKSKNAKSICFAAFNKSIQLELEKRVPDGVQAKTMHSLGYGAVRNHFGLKQAPNGNRVRLLLEEVSGRHIRDIDSTIVSAVDKLVGLSKANLVVDPTNEDFYVIASSYDIELNDSEDKIFDYSREVLKLAADEACIRRQGFIDFNDMIWLPVVHKLGLPKFDLLLVDEAQDLNRCQQELAMRCGRRLILCGDPSQAIYGFAGADSDSLPNMFNRLSETSQGCVELRLTVTRRCGKAIVQEANKFVPDFVAHDTNGQGDIKHSLIVGLDKPKDLSIKVDDNKLHYRNFVKPGDMVICRVNAPLVSECFKMIKMGKKANIQGRDIGQGLVNMIIKMSPKSIADLADKVGRWYEKEVAKENAKKFPSETRLQSLSDRRDCIDCFLAEADTVDQLIRRINDIFTDNGTPGVLLTSIHKAKGLEARRVFILDPKKVPFPHPMARSAAAKAQEYNLRYVAVTRAIETLVYVSEE